MTLTTPDRFIILQKRQNFFTDARTFIITSYLSRSIFPFRPFWPAKHTALVSDETVFGLQSQSQP